nr:hypothetical protein [Mesorhizobium mediterraneum]
MGGLIMTSKDRITAEDVVMLRREVFGDGVVTRGEAEALFALDATKDKCAEWPDFFIEAVTDFIVHQEKPAGYISQDNADWLVRAISRDGMVDSWTELELLVHVLEKAKSSPNGLCAYALEQVAHAVIDGKGPLMHGGRLVPGLIAKAEVELLRRILYAHGGDGNIAITRAEAEMLFKINERTAAVHNDPSWNDLFVKAIANFVMCSAGYEAPMRAVALRRDSFLDQADPEIGGFFGAWYRAVSPASWKPIARRAISNPNGNRRTRQPRRWPAAPKPSTPARRSGWPSASAATGRCMRTSARC